jgi:hypothetical protein
MACFAAKKTFELLKMPDNSDAATKQYPAGARLAEGN